MSIEIVTTTGPNAYIEYPTLEECRKLGFDEACAKTEAGNLSQEGRIPEYTAIHAEALQHGCLPLEFVRKVSDMMAETQALSHAAEAKGLTDVAVLAEALTDALYTLTDAFSVEKGSEE